ncbi:MAG TPA: hypothetical protein EYQ85_03195 [Candidatus Poseidoniales archaeon]|nr:hypothetical protein [Candidatus Poseidoniales archaeon]
MRAQVIFASLLMLIVPLAGCITDSAVEQTTDDTVEQTTIYTISATDSLGDGGHVITVTHSDGSSLCSIGTYSTYWGDSWPDASCTFALSSGTATVSYESGETDYFQLTVTLTTPSGTTSDISPTASFGPEILAFLPLTEVWGCLDASSLNYDVNATKSSDLCLSEEQLLLAEEVFWSSWDADAINNATGPIGYRLMIGETSADDNESACLEIQEVFSPDYYDQKIVGAFESDNISAGTCEERAEQIYDGQNDTAEGRGGTVKFFNDVKGFGFKNSQTVFDNVVQVEKFSDGEWDNYSMDTASTYDEFRNRLEHGPGIRSSDDCCAEAADGLEQEVAGGREDGGPGNNDCNDRRDCVNPGFPSVVDSEYTHTVIDEVELRGSGHAQTIYYFAKDASTGTEIEVMGEMTEDGFKITEYYNEIANTNISIIGSYMTPTDLAVGDNNTVTRDGNGCWQIGYCRVSARIILLEADGDELRFEEYDYDEPVNYRSENQSQDGVIYELRAIPFYFEWIPDEDTNETENKSATEEGKKGLNAVNVKVVIAGPSGPYGMEGDLSDYRLVTSNCTLDNKTTGIDATTEADDETTSARSEGTNGSDVDFDDVVYGSAGNSCTDIDAYDLSDIDGLLEHGIVFVDADSSGTLSEGDRFEFSDNFTCDDCVEANMLRLYSISADGFSDGNINPSSKMSLVHEGAMNAIRNIRAVGLDPQMVDIRLETFRKG